MIFFDTETFLIAPGAKAPRIVCVTTTEGIASRDDARDTVEAWLRAEHLCAHNAAFDMSAICATWPELTPLVFQAYAENRVSCTMIRQWLCDTATGDFEGFYHSTDNGVHRADSISYSLAALVKRHLGRIMDKDQWRLGYADLDHLPLEQWPDGAIAYAMDDAAAVRGIYAAQDARWLADEHRQARAYWWLHLSAVWGIAVDQRKVDTLENATRAEYATIARALETQGLKRPDRMDRNGKLVEGSRDTKAVAAAIARALPDPPRTPTGAIRTDGETCEAAGEPLRDYARFGKLKKALSTDIPLLRAGSIVHTRYGWAVSGRTTSTDPNLQNTPREGGVKGCFVARPGRVFASIDAGGLELATMAECWHSILGYSKLAEAINAGVDPHLMMAAHILGIPYDTAKANKTDKQVKNARQSGKVANFGFPGGLGAERLCEFAHRLYRVTITPDEAKALKGLWLQAWPEAREYFRVIDSTVNSGGLIQQIYSERWRGGVGYTDACNTMFQGLGADVMKHLGWMIAEEQYCDPDGALYGSRTVVFEHDAFIVECHEARGHDVAMRLEALMAEAGKLWLPHVKLGGEAALSRCWEKDPPRVFENGRLVCPK